MTETTAPLSERSQKLDAAGAERIPPPATSVPPLPPPSTGAVPSGSADGLSGVPAGAAHTEAIQAATLRAVAQDLLNEAAFRAPVGLADPAAISAENHHDADLLRWAADRYRRFAEDFAAGRVISLVEAAPGDTP